MHRAFHIGYLLVIALLLIFFVVPDRPDPVHSPEPPARNVPDTAMPANELTGSEVELSDEANLRSEIANLQTQIERLEGELRRERAETAPELPSTRNESGSAADYQADGMARHPDRLDQRFEAEHRDAEWAYAEEDRITDLLYAQSETGEFQLEQVECRETTCRVVLQLENVENDAQQRLHTLLREELGYRNSSAYLSRANQRVYITVERTNGD